MEKNDINDTNDSNEIKNSKENIKNETTKRKWINPLDLLKDKNTFRTGLMIKKFNNKQKK
jgi:hypothetical protein